MAQILARRRQNKVAHTAAKSSAIVSSMFPKHVRERLFQDDMAAVVNPPAMMTTATSSADNDPPASSASVATATTGRRSNRQRRLQRHAFLNAAVTTNTTSNATTADPSTSTLLATEQSAVDAVADTYPCKCDCPSSLTRREITGLPSLVAALCYEMFAHFFSHTKLLLDVLTQNAFFFVVVTICFANIVGFSEWSNHPGREPSHIFTLLEALFGAFDRIAQAQGIYKVETSGDVYIAAAGIPEPHADHAVAMARFATDCRDASVEVFHKLQTEMGEGTGLLSLRFGLHSGKVLAGVVRGQRARFQLYGEAIGIAAAMERSVAVAAERTGNYADAHLCFASHRSIFLFDFS